MKVPVTGGPGYIGSTIASACLDAGICPVILDNRADGIRHSLQWSAIRDEMLGR